MSVKSRDFSLNQIWLSEPSSLPLEVYRDSVQGINRPEREADHSNPSSAKVKNEWSYTSTTPIFLCLKRLDKEIHFNPQLLYKNYVYML